MPTNTAQTAMDQLAKDEQARSAASDAQASGSRNQFMDHLAGGQDALDDYTRGAMSRGMPGLKREIQGSRASSNRRGVGIGGLATSYEGDIYSAFQQNIADSVSGQAMNMYNTQSQGYGNMYNTDSQLGESSRNRYADVIAGNRDAEIARNNAEKQKKASIWGSILGTVGSIAGTALLPGVGTAIGGKLGSSVGDTVSKKMGG